MSTISTAGMHPLLSSVVHLPFQKAGSDVGCSEFTFKHFQRAIQAHLHILSAQSAMNELEQHKTWQALMQGEVIAVECLDDETGHDDRQEEEEHDCVIRGVVGLSLIAEAVGPPDVAPVNRQKYADEDRQTEKIHHEGEDEVERPPEKGPAEGLCDVKFRGVDGRPYDEDQKSEEDEPVYDPGVGFPEGLHLEEPVDQERFYPLREAVETRLRSSESDPQPPPPVNPVSEDDEGHHREAIEEKLESLGIPEDLPALIADGKCDTLHNPPSI